MLSSQVAFHWSVVMPGPLNPGYWSAQLWQIGERASTVGHRVAAPRPESAQYRAQCFAHEEDLVKAVIIAGGMGTRIRTVTGDAVPKALLPVAGIPIIHRQFRLLKRYGFSEVLLTAGHLADTLHAGCVPEADRLGLALQIAVEPKALGTGGGLPALRNLLASESFLVLCGDIAVDMDLERLITFHQRSNADATVVVHPNDHPHTSDLVVVDETNRVRDFIPRGSQSTRNHRNCVIGSVYVLSSRVWDYIEPDTKQDLNNDILPRMVDAGARVLAYNTPEYLRDVGTLERLAIVERDIASGRMERMNWRHRRPAVFFDRDGVLVKDAGPDGVTAPEQIRLLPGAVDAIRAVNEAGLLAIVVSNQPGIAKGFISLEDLEDITGRMEMELGRGGAWLDRVYYCPHHPDIGFAGERPEFKISCECRKPGPGLLLRAADELPLDLPSSVLIGDTARDIGAARAAGILAYGVRTGHGCADCEDALLPDAMDDSVLDAVKRFLESRPASC
jgi:histidinol-phosphate phosphatase family protein